MGAVERQQRNKGTRTNAGGIWLIMLVLVAPSVVILSTDEAWADSAGLMSATLPSPRYSPSAIWDGSNAYIFGGWSGGSTLNEIVRYNPSTDGVTIMSATLPSGRHDTSAIWDGSNAYIFGGYSSGSGASNQIVRYNPSTDTITLMGATLPTARYQTSAIWDGSNAYIFGGWDGSSLTNQIVRYNPSTDTIALMSPLPDPRTETSAVWDGSNAYIFGGTKGGSPLNQIVRFNPSANTATLMSAILPSGRSQPSAVWDGSNAYIFGGWSGSSTLNEIVRYNPSANMVTTMNATLPSGRSQTGAAWDGSNAYIFGGVGGSTLNEIVRYNLRPGAPQNLVASAGYQQITLTWQAPPSNTYSSLTSYRVYAGSTSGSESLVTTGGCSNLGNVLTCTYTGLGNATTRYYKVTASNSAGEGPESNEATARTFALSSAPRSLAATPGYQQVRLTWSAPTSDGGTPITNYRIYRGINLGPDTFLTQVGNVLTYTDSTCSLWTVCSYKVTAVNVVGESSASAGATSTGTSEFSPGLPPGWARTTLLAQNIPVNGTPVSQNLLIVDGRPRGSDPDIYDVNVTVAGQPLPTIGVNTGGNVQQPIHLALLDMPGEQAWVNFTVSYQYDPSQVTCLASVGDTCVNGPLDPFNPAWVLASGHQATLVFDIRIVANGQTIAHQFVAIPFGGQASAVIT